jgi:hypothetical protein
MYGDRTLLGIGWVKDRGRAEERRREGRGGERRGEKEGKEGFIGRSCGMVGGHIHHDTKLSYEFFYFFDVVGGGEYFDGDSLSCP